MPLNWSFLKGLLCRILYVAIYQSRNKLHTRRKVKGQHGCCHHGHGKEGTALEPLRLWTSNIDEVFNIEQRLCAAKVGHGGQSWTEATEDYKFT